VKKNHRVAHDGGVVEAAWKASGNMAFWNAIQESRIGFENAMRRAVDRGIDGAAFVTL
jgi:hypothetical protein